jgi:hypothetical protein
MAREKRDLVSILRRELEYLKSGGYRTPQQAAWRPQFIFEDSPTCVNHRNFERRLPCSQCALIELVPEGQKQEKFPCRHIPLDESGQTLHSLYRMGTEEETHALVAEWLKNTIERLERERASAKLSSTNPDALPISNAHVH